MQFKHPELLWALLLLLIPIIIHLFRLRKFKKTPFTNVRLLQNIISQTRKSQSLKKWLLLCTRLLLFASVILAFTQPFEASEMASVPTETAIYLDDSFSMQARTENGDLLQMAVQELIRNLPEDEEVSIFTNERSFERSTPAEIQNQLLSLNHSYKQLSMDEVVITARALFNNNKQGVKQLFVISDFQDRMYSIPDSLPDMSLHFVQLRPESPLNISIDTVYIDNTTPTQLELKARLTADGEAENTAVSIWNADTLIAKTAARFEGSRNTEINFSLPSDIVIDGLVEIGDEGLSYDNQLYFNINQTKKIRVMHIGENSNNYINRIFSENEFELLSSELDNLNYSDITNQNLIILHQLRSIPNSLQTVLRSFYSEGGSLVIIPSKEAELASFNSFLSSLGAATLTEYVDTEQAITSISFDHPLYRNVFERRVANFQYPYVNGYYRISRKSAEVLGLQNGDPFLIGSDRIYIFSSPIDASHSNFSFSPLIVPSFYNMGIMSLAMPALYHPLSSSTKIDIPVALPSDQIARVRKGQYEFIPLQQSYTNKTTLDFEEHPSQDGIFDIVLGDSLVSRISFNYPRDESDLTYARLEAGRFSSLNNKVEDLLNEMEKRKSVKELWPWFVILALLFTLIEVLVQKLIK